MESRDGMLDVCPIAHQEVEDLGNGSERHKRGRMDKTPDKDQRVSFLSLRRSVPQGNLHSSSWEAHHTIPQFPGSSVSTGQNRSEAFQQGRLGSRDVRCQLMLQQDEWLDW